MAFAGLGILAIIAAITYTVGAKPYGYLGFRRSVSIALLVYWVWVEPIIYKLTALISLITLPALGSGLLATAVLNINNLRDIEQDAKVGKNTLVVRIGPKKGRIYHCVLLSVAALCYVLFAVSTAFSPWHFLFLLAFPLLLKHALFVYRSKEPAVLRPMLAQMSMISLFINILFSLGLLIG